MCGVLGGFIKAPNSADFTNIKNLFIESSIRGLHATGISYVTGGKVVTIKEPLPAEKFVKMLDFDSMVNEDGNLYFVGHCRYSTSNLDYNQPIADDSLSIVHNGVITQEEPMHWGYLYGVKCETENDSEILFQKVKAGEEIPVHLFGDYASIACIELRADKQIKAYRNGKRPLIISKIDDNYIFTSTSDIVHRAGLSPIISIYSSPDTVYTIRNSELLTNYTGYDYKDYQQ